MRLFFIVFALFLIGIDCGCTFAETGQQQMIALAATAETDGVLQGKDGWLFLKEEVEHLGSPAFFGEQVVKVSKAAKPEFADPLPAIVDFNNQLKARNIKLVFVPVPPKALIYPDKLPGVVSRQMIAELRQPYAQLYAKLATQGIQVLDLIPLFEAGREQAQLYCKTDSHYSGAGVLLVAKELSHIIQQTDWYPAVPRKEYVTTKRTVTIRGDLSVMQHKEANESLELFFVSDAVTGKTIQANPDSPVLLLGDSHTLVFSAGGDLHATGAGLLDRLTADLGFAPDLIGVRGSGATPSRIKLYQRSRKEPSFLDKKKVVVWCLSARELTGSGGWRKIPVAKK